MEAYFQDLRKNWFHVNLLVCINTICDFVLMRLLPCPRCPTSPVAGTFPCYGPCLCKPRLQCSSSVSANSEHPFGDSQTNSCLRQGLQVMTATQLPVTPLHVLPTASVLLLLPPAEHGKIKQQQSSAVKYGTDWLGRNLLCTPGQERSLRSQGMGHPMFNYFKWQWGICFPCSSEQKQPLTYLAQSVGCRGGGRGVFHLKHFLI